MEETVAKTRGLRKRYGRLTALERLDLDIPRGSIFGLIGPNGAGKSTTFGLMCGWLHPSAGTTYVLDTPSHSLHNLRGKVAALPQDSAFPPQGAIVEQLAHFARLSGLGKSDARMRAESVLARVDLLEHSRRRGHELSHGMLKRAGLAQALIDEPEVLFLDEPTAGLDPRSSRQLKDIIRGLAPGATVVLSSHNLPEVQELCTHAAVLDHGHIVTSGTIDEITRQGAEIRIEIASGTDVPREQLEQAFGDDNVKLTSGVILIRFVAGKNPAEVINATLRILLDANVPILAVARGTSLEEAFLEITAHPSVD